MSFFVALLAPAGPLAAPLAVVLFTVAVRALISPLSYLQARAARRQAGAAPEVRGLLIALLPALAQAPFFILMFRMAMSPPAGALFGVPLTAHLLAGLPVFAVLLALAVLLAHLTSRRMTGLRFLPYLSVAAVAWLPLAGALYLVTSTAWTALEHVWWRRPVTTGNG